MSKPKVFISSTFFDLKQVRESIDNFITGLGFLPIRNEEGHIPYGINEQLDLDCYDEVNECDILVSIIGSRYGSDASSGSSSISQNELNYAIAYGKQVYIFIDKNVQAEYETYKLNRNVRKLKLRHVDNIKIYQFLDELYSRGLSKPMFPFETAKDIINKLREQWAGLFQRLLQSQEEKIRFNVVEKLENTTDALNQMIGYILEKDENRDHYLDILQKSNHPAFTRLSQVFLNNYKVMFSDIHEFAQYIKLYGFTYPQIVKPGFNTDEYFFWQSFGTNESVEIMLMVSKRIFSDDGQFKLQYISFDDWDDSLIQMHEISTLTNAAVATE